MNRFWWQFLLKHIHFGEKIYMTVDLNLLKSWPPPTLTTALLWKFRHFSFYWYIMNIAITYSWPVCYFLPDTRSRSPSLKKPKKPLKIGLKIYRDFLVLAFSAIVMKHWSDRKDHIIGQMRSVLVATYVKRWLYINEKSNFTSLRRRAIKLRSFAAQQFVKCCIECQNSVSNVYQGYIYWLTLRLPFITIT